jgi:hypothetical protein
VGFDFIKNSIIVTLLIALFVAIAGIAFFSINDCLGFFAGAIWSCLNIYFLYQLLHQIILQSTKSALKILGLFVLKFPLLYGIGLWLLQNSNFSVWSLSLGLFLAIGVFFFKSYQIGIESI